MAIIIQGTQIPDSDSVFFTVISGASTCLYTSFEWHLSGNTGDSVVGNDSTYTLVSPLPGDKVYLKIKNYSGLCPIYWRDGQFYGGTFTGNFSGGSFYYGTLNGCKYPQLSKKPRPFIKKDK